MNFLEDDVEVGRPRKEKVDSIPKGLTAVPFFPNHQEYYSEMRRLREGAEESAEMVLSQFRPCKKHLRKDEEEIEDTA